MVVLIRSKDQMLRRLLREWKREELKAETEGEKDQPQGSQRTQE
jgi:hypothetical protein